jgi:hypothetical protein
VGRAWAGLEWLTGGTERPRGSVGSDWVWGERDAALPHGPGSTVPPDSVLN